MGSRVCELSSCGVVCRLIPTSRVSRGWARWAGDRDSHQTLSANSPDRPHLLQKQTNHRFLMPELVFISGVKIAKERKNVNTTSKMEWGRAGTEARIGG